MKCTNKFDWPIYEMFFIRELRPPLNVKSDSTRAEDFNYETFLRSFAYKNCLTTLTWNTYIQKNCYMLFDNMCPIEPTLI